MAVLNITYGGSSTDHPLDLMVELTDSDIRRIAVELIRAGAAAFEHYVVDRFTSPGGERRIYLRPKVPFGGPRSA
jgi:hypothetical protein